MDINASEFIRKFVQEKAAINLDAGKDYLVQSRLAKLLEQERLGSLDELVVKLKSNLHRDLHQKVIECLTTHETSFFRDGRPFDGMKRSLFPDLINKLKDRRRLHIWCGASSTGQEVYSLMILIAENFSELFNWDFKVFASDISSEVLNKAKMGRYNGVEVSRGLSEGYLQKYFTKTISGEWEVSQSLLKKVEFFQLNLIQPWTVPPVDLVLLRNVLIYFDVETKKQLLQKACKTIRPGGYLVLGSSETIMGLSDAYVPKTLGMTTFYQVR